MDARILEHLCDESWATPSYMARLQGVHATEAQVRERCRVLADADLVAFPTDHQNLVGLTTLGMEYLKGEVDIGLYPRPRHPRVME